MNLDIGDIVGVQGGIRRTDRGELSVTADSLQVCCCLPARYAQLLTAVAERLAGCRS